MDRADDRVTTAYRGLLCSLLVGILVGGTPFSALAQTQADVPRLATPQVRPSEPIAAASAHDAAPAAPTSEQPESGKSLLHVSAGLTVDSTYLKAGLMWRVFDATPTAAGTYTLVAQSTDAQATFKLVDGSYMVHVAYGFASAMKQVQITGRAVTERLNLNAGGIEVKGLNGDDPITPDRLSLSIFVPERNNSEAKLVVSGAKPGQIIRLPEGPYHVVSTYLDTVGVGSLTPVTDTNSTVSADLRVQAGKLIEATVRHRTAVLTLKLVNAAGGEALANTSFTILTPGGDIIRELIGAFPSLVLAEGDYLVIARHNGRTFQSEFKVQSNLDRDVEVIAQSQP
ncbi:hypothetical protein [Lichenihabitans psoromatis]|uniref:hypothetical protein n=1 Tax=Lichenihabitans psoromatis TaxID=2528642 RepID=UPI00103843E5|nr:hypothetical protein [Lichenihabitans psoromatis]